MSDFVNNDFARGLPRTPTTRVLSGAGKAGRRTKIDPRDAGKAKPTGKAAGSTAQQAKSTNGYTPRRHAADVAEQLEHKAEGIGNGVFMLDLMIVPIAMVIGRVAGVIPGVGPYIRTGLSGPLLSLSRSLAATKVTEIVKLPGNFMHEWGSFAEQVHGEKHFLSKGFKSAGRAMGENVSTQLNAGHAAKTEHFTKQLLSEFSDGAAKETFATRRAVKLRAKHLEKATKEAEAVLTRLAEPHNGMLTQVKNGLKDMTAFVARKESTRPLPAAHEVPAEFKGVHREAQALVDTLKGTHPEHVDYAHMMGRIEGLHTELHAASQLAVADRAVASRAGAIRGQLQTLGGSAESAVFQHARANGAPMSRYAKQAAKNLNHMSAGTAVMKGSFAALAPAMAVKTTLHVKDHLHNLKELYAQVSGKPANQVSTFDVLFSKKMPEVVQQARHGLIKKFGPELVADAGSMAVNAHFLLNKGGAGLMMGGFMAQMMAGNLTDGNDLLETYGQIREMERAGVDVPEEMLTKLIGNGSKKAASHGGEANMMVRRMAHEYKEAGIGSSVILKEITDGKSFDARAMEIQKTIAAEREAAKSEAKDTLAKKDTPSAKVLASHAVAVADKPAHAINDNAPSVKLGGEMEHQGKLAQAHREVAGA